jgi:hypothetical protein
MAMGFRTGMFGKSRNGLMGIMPGDQQSVGLPDPFITERPMPVPGGNPGAGPQPPKRGLFGMSDSFAEKLAIVGAALRDNAAPDLIPQYMMGKQQLAREAQQAEARRLADREDYTWKLGQKAMFDTPNDDVFTRMLRGAGIDPNSEQGQKLYRQRAGAMANPPRMVMGADGRPYFVNGADTQGSDLGPDLGDGWEIDGGPTPTASGTFR